MLTALVPLWAQVLEIEQFSDVVLSVWVECKSCYSSFVRSACSFVLNLSVTVHWSRKNPVNWCYKPAWLLYSLLEQQNITEVFILVDWGYFFFFFSLSTWAEEKCSKCKRGKANAIIISIPTWSTIPLKDNAEHRMFKLFYTFKEIFKIPKCCYFLLM